MAALQDKKIYKEGVLQKRQRGLHDDLNGKTKRFHRVGPSLYREVLKKKDCLLFRHMPEIQVLHVDLALSELRVILPLLGHS